MIRSCESEHPMITRWVKEFGGIEIGYDSPRTPLARR